LEILDILAKEPANTIFIIAIGPLTNIALAAAADPITLARAKEIVIMGGALAKAGNITPLAEFNVYADAMAAARVFALTSPLPESTMPPSPPESEKVSNKNLPPYPSPESLGDARLNLVLFPLDITEQHPILRSHYLARTKDLRAKGSPLAEWHAAFMKSVFEKMEILHEGHADETTSVVLHDPHCVWWAMQGSRFGFKEAEPDEWLQKDTSREWKLSPPMDIRVETTGQWSRGACVVDRRDRKKEVEALEDAKKLGDISGDAGAWLSDKRGNRVRVCVGTPGTDALVDLLLNTVFGV
jgi:inosine-uridine nucleoside N-ribohydrolase